LPRGLGDSAKWRESYKTGTISEHFDPKVRNLYNGAMPNRAYASIWIRDFNEGNMLTHFEHFLASAPLSPKPLSYTELVIRAVNFTEPPLEEHDLRGQAFTPAEIIEIAREDHSDDVSYEVSARWDLWIRDMEAASWKKNAERLVLCCNGLRYDDGIFAESGHLMADLGFEHLFTGHAGLLTSEDGRGAEPAHPDEARFLMWMSQPQNLCEYQEKTRENIQKLMGWMRTVEETMPVERFRLWSEGEENFEARLDEILAVR
jgi:hypothetical protein